MPSSQSPRVSRTWSVAQALCVGLALAPVAAAQADLPLASAPSPTATPPPTPAVLAVQKALPAVVSISSEKKASSPSRWPFSPEENARPRVSGMGTGVLIDPRGYILTNHHVVDKVQGIEAQLADGSVLAARVLQFDKAHDLAILKVDAPTPLPFLPMGTSGDLRLAEQVITIGNAFGYENTVSVGTVSWIGRNVTLSDEQVYRNLIQTDACINPGNSGGPLIDSTGELVGINVAVRAGAQGIGFALPIDDVKKVAADLMSTRRIAGTWHGLAGEEQITPEGRGVVLATIKANSPAAAAGLAKGDRVVRIGSTPVACPLDVERGLLDARPGTPVPVLIARGGRETTVGLTVEALPRPAANPSTQVWQSLGIEAVPVGAEYVNAVSPKLRGGLYVKSVAADSPGQRANIAKGDILVGMLVGTRQWETIRPDNVLYVLDQYKKTAGVSLQYFLIRRNAIKQGLLEISNVQPASARR